MVTRHIHLVANWNGRKQFEWSEVSDNVKSTSTAVERTYKLPRHVYNFYKSAEIHTKQEKRKPVSFYFVCGVLVFALVAILFTIHRINKRINPVDLVQESTVDSSVMNTDLTVSDSLLKSSSSSGDSVDISTPELLQAALTPVVVGVPWSAPFYKQLAKPVSMPVIKGCLKSKKIDDHRCACFTQQGTFVDVPSDVCSLYVDRAAFNPFRPDSNKIMPDSIQAKNMVDGQ